LLEKSVENYKQLGYTSEQRIFKNIQDGLSVARDPSLGI
jgi:hypothetical protein